MGRYMGRAKNLLQSARAAVKARPIFVSHCGPDGFPFGDQMASLSEDDICLQTWSANHPCLHNSLIAKLPTYEAAETWASTRHRPLIKSLDWLFKVHNKEFLQHLLAIASEFSAESHGRTMVFVRSLYVYTVCVYLCVSVCVRTHTYIIYVYNYIYIYITLYYIILQQMKVHCFTGWL